MDPDAGAEKDKGIKPQAQNEKTDEASADAPGSPQEQGGLVVLLEGRSIVLSPLLPSDFPLLRVIVGGQHSVLYEYQSMAMTKLVSLVISRSALTPEDMVIVQQNPLKTYFAISAAIERQLHSILSEP